MADNQKQHFRSRLFQSKFNHTINLYYNDNSVTNINDIVREIKGINYKLGTFASCDMILHDKEKRIHHDIFFNNGNKITILINNIDGTSLYFIGYIKSFQPIDAEEDLYSIKLWSVYDFSNLKLIRKGFPGIKKISDILEETLADELLYGEEIAKGFRIIEETETTLENFIIPGWNILTLLNKLTPYASKFDNIFMYYEDSRGLIFINRKSLFENNINRLRPVFKFTPNQITNENQTDDNTLEQLSLKEVPFNIIYDYDVDGFNAMEHRKSKDFGTNVTIFNYKDKSTSKFDFNFADQFKNLNTLNKYSILGEDYMNNIAKTPNIEYTSFPELVNNYGKYNTLDASMQDYSITIKTNFAGYLNISDFVRLDFPGIIGAVESLSGNWMVGAIRHRLEISEGLTRESRLSTYITLIRDSINIDNNIAKALNLLKKEKLIVKE